MSLAKEFSRLENWRIKNHKNGLWINEGDNFFSWEENGKEMGIIKGGSVSDGLALSREMGPFQWITLQSQNEIVRKEIINLHFCWYHDCFSW
jgi:hypothetical protein